MKKINLPRAELIIFLVATDLCYTMLTEVAPGYQSVRFRKDIFWTLKNAKNAIQKAIKGIMHYEISIKLQFAVEHYLRIQWLLANCKYYNAGDMLVLFYFKMLLL